MNPSHAPIDAGEGILAMEPMLPSRESIECGDLPDQVLMLVVEAAAFKSSLPAGVATALADLVRVVNCYFSNLIEGRDTHPISIERALADDYSNNPEQRNLQREARAHIEVQRWIDSGGLAQSATSVQAIVEIHRRLYAGLPDELLVATDPDTKEEARIVPGEFRKGDVKVGRHIPISPGAVPRFLARFEEVYGGLGKIENILALAAAHHRFVWIHPFLDGNGRVARLMTHAMMMKAVDSGGLWSISRGLARNVGDYRVHLAACDAGRRGALDGHGALDGRGALSEGNLLRFTEFFLDMCIDEIQFMRELVQPEKLHGRIMAWVQRESGLPKKSELVLEAILYRGEVPRGDIPGLLGLTERQARRITSAILEAGVVTSASSRAPLKLAFPARIAEHWMPGLFPPGGGGE